MVIAKTRNLPGLSGGVNLLLPVLLLLLATGCFRPGRTIRDVPPGEWPASLGGPSRTPYAAEQAPEAPRDVWQEGMERGVVAPPIVHGALLLVGSTGRVLTAASAATGSEYWHRRFNGPVVGSPLRTGDTILFATAERDGRIYAYSVDRGRKLWQRRLRAPVTSEPVLHGGRVYAGTTRAELFAVSASDGAIDWQVRLPGDPLHAPVVHSGALLVATANDTLLRVQLEGGAVLGRVAMPGTITAAPALAGDRLLVPVHPRHVATFDPATLQLLGTDSLDAAVHAAPGVDANGDAYLLTAAGSVWRLPAGGGHAERTAALGGTARESLTLAANGLLVGRLDGTLVLLRRDGTEVWRRSYPASIRAPVALADGAAYVSLLNGRIVKLQ